VDQTQKITKCVVGSLLQEFFLNHTNIATKLVAFGSNGVNVFHVKFGVTKKLQETCTPFSFRVHHVFHRTNLVMQTLSSFLLVHRMETLFQSLY
jgi:hypothetical protein